MQFAFCPFCKIVAGREFASRVYEDTLVLGILDHRPLFPGHVLLVPREHIVDLDAAEEAMFAHMMRTVKLLSHAIERGLQVQGTFVALNNKVSQSVPHLHMHVVPRKKRDGLRGFFWPRQRYENSRHMEHVRELIAGALHSPLKD